MEPSQIPFSLQKKKSRLIYNIYMIKLFFVIKTLSNEKKVAYQVQGDDPNDNILYFALFVNSVSLYS